MIGTLMQFPQCAMVVHYADEAHSAKQSWALARKAAPKSEPRPVSHGFAR